MRRANIGVAAAMLVAVSSAYGGDMPARAASTAEVTRNNNVFALELYGKLKDGKGNLFLSPYSVSTALAMTYAGARGNTEAEMAGTLHLGPNGRPLHDTFGQIVAEMNAAGQQGKFKLCVANSLWAQRDYKFLKSFTDLVAGSYAAGLNLVDFAGATEPARLAINNWVEDNTEKKIKDLLQPGILSGLTRLVLVNAIYFKGNWECQFDKSKTLEETFTLADGTEVTAPLMHQRKQYGYMETPEFQALELPYTGRELAMIVLLPGKPDGVPSLEAGLTPDDLASWTKSLSKRDVVVTFPRFKITSAFSLSKPLIALGMKDAFDALKADFSGMDGGRDLFISAAVHKAFADVNEEGTEAAAATAVVMSKRSVSRPEQPVQFRADRPFIFLIRHNATGAILFMGRLMDPTA